MEEDVFEKLGSAKDLFCGAPLPAYFASYLCASFDSTGVRNSAGRSYVRS